MRIKKVKQYEVINIGFMIGNKDNRSFCLKLINALQNLLGFIVDNYLIIEVFKEFMHQISAALYPKHRLLTKHL